MEGTVRTSDVITRTVTREAGVEFAMSAAAAVACVGLLVLGGWLAGSPQVARLGLSSIPMAPSTASCFLALCSAVGLRAWRPAKTRIVRVNSVLVAAVALLALLPGAPLETLIRERLFGESGRFEGFPVAVMSPVTATLFIALSAALSLQSLGPRLRQASAVLALAVTATGGVVVLGYAFGAPLFQQGRLVIPLALPTGLCFAVLGAGALGGAGAAVWPNSALVGQGVRARLLRAFLPITASIVLAVAWLAIWIAMSQRGNPAIWAAGLASLSLALVIFVVSGQADRIALVLEASERSRTAAVQRQVEIEHRARMVLACADEGILELDEKGLVVFANPAAQALLGPEAELVGRSHDKLLHGRNTLNDFGSSPGDQPDSICGVCECLRSGKGFRAPRAALRSLRDERFPAAYSVSPIVENDAITGGVLTFSDLTEFQSLEQQLRQAQKMEAMGQLAGGVAHDFNNLLTVILSFSQFVADELGPEHRAAPDVLEVQRAAERATALTRQLLAFSRHQPEAPVLLDLNAVLVDMDKMLRRLIGEHIELVTLPDPNLVKVLVDRGHIEQVIANLVVNARDAMPNGGKLTLETGNVEIDETHVRGRLAAKAGSYAMLAATDTGTGMDEATRARIFEPFFTTKEAGKGTGLGLATVYGILKQADGDVLVYSALGRGTTFKLYFPRAERTAEAAPKADSSTPRSAGDETILLVEDEDAVRTVAVRALELAGYTVLAASTPAAALALAASHTGPISALVTDVVMPGMDGPELARHLVASRPRITVVFMSGYTGGALTHHGILTGNLAYIPKPFTPQSFVRALRAILDGTTPPSLPPGLQ